MENVIIQSNKSHIIIRIPIKSIIIECKNEDWNESHNIAPIKDKEAMVDYVKIALEEASVDLGNGQVTPVAIMIMDIIQQAYDESLDFLVDQYDDDDD